MNVDRQLGEQATWPGLVACVIAISGALLTGCNKPSEKPASQVAAKVNKEELTVHQINFLLEQQRGLNPEQAEVARRQALERLIDQELAIQKASEIKLDRDPRVMQKLEAARRDIIARAYFERVGGGASKPTDSQIYKYYSDNPALFSERRTYQLQEWSIEVPPDQVDEVRANTKSAKGMGAFTEYLKARNLRFEFNHAIRAAEQLPLNSLATFAKMSDGDSIINAKPNGLQVIALVGSRLEPVELAQARPAIEQFLMNEQKGHIIADDLKAMRTAAAIRYMGSFDEASNAATESDGARPAIFTASSSASGALVSLANSSNGTPLK